VSEQLHCVDAKAGDAPLGDVRELAIDELEQFVVAAGERAFRAR